MKNYTIFIFIFMLFLSSNGYAKEKITVAGTGDSQKLMRTLALEFEKLHPNTKIHVPNSIGSGGGIKSAAMGKVEIGRVARVLKKSEEKYNLTYKLIAYSAMVFVVNQSVENIESLSSQQIVDIYSGKIKKWEELNAKEGKIYVASREAGDSSYEIISNTIDGFSNIKKMAGETLYSSPEMTQTVDMYANTIGYMALSQTKNTKLKIMKYNNIEPSIKNISEGKYPLVLPIGIVYKELTPLSKKFIDFILSSKGKKIIHDFGLVCKQH